MGVIETETADPNAGTPRASPGWAVAVAVGLTGAAFLLALIGGIAFLIPVLILELDIESTPVFLALTVAGQLGFVAVGYGYARYAGMEIPITRPSARQVGYALGGTVAALVVAVVLSVAVDALGLTPGSVIGDAAAIDPAVMLGIGALSILVVAPAEEFLFRGVIQGRLRTAFGPVGAIAGASLLFGSLHLTNYTGATAAVVAGAAVIVGTGSVFGVLYERTGTLTVPIIAHAAYNVVLSVLAYASL
jgi:membrane protease YdiL (CAAX protease family)